MEVEQLDQQITLELQTIDNNILEISNIITTKIQPVVQSFNEKFENILHNAEFHKKMFQAAGNLKDLSYMTVSQKNSALKRASLHPNGQAAEKQNGDDTENALRNATEHTDENVAGVQNKNGENDSMVREEMYNQHANPNTPHKQTYDNTSELFKNPPILDTVQKLNKGNAPKMTKKVMGQKTSTTQSDDLLGDDYSASNFVSGLKGKTAQRGTEDDSDADKDGDEEEASVLKQQRKKRKMSLMIQQQFASSSEDELEDDPEIMERVNVREFKESTRDTLG
ncbi:hypothetical protein ACO0QE_001980 [Hanseniaspora vineae]